MDTVLYFFSDPHAGSLVSLFPGRQLQLKSGYRNPSPQQQALYRQFSETNELVANLRRGKRLAVIVTGDVIEGQHHDTKELISPYLIDQNTVATDLLNELLQRVSYSKENGDALYFVDGTPAHAGEAEYQIAKDFDAIPYIPPTEPDSADGLYTWPLLRRFVNGKLFWIAHHGPAAGRTVTRGDGMRRALRDIRATCIETGQTIPDVVIWAHNHDHWHEVVEFQNGDVMDGFSLPSWKLKDGYLYRRSPFAFSNIGGLVMTVRNNGACEYQFSTIHVEQDETGEL